MTPYLILAISLTVAATSYFSALNLAMVQASRSGLETELEARGLIEITRRGQGNGSDQPGRV